MKLYDIWMLCRDCRSYHQHNARKKYLICIGSFKYSLEN